MKKALDPHAKHFSLVPDSLEIQIQNCVTARLFEHKTNLTEIIREIHLTEIVKFQTCQTTLPTPQNPFLAGELN